MASDLTSTARPWARYQLLHPVSSSAPWNEHPSFAELQLLNQKTHVAVGGGRELWCPSSLSLSLWLHMFLITEHADALLSPHSLCPNVLMRLVSDVPNPHASKMVLSAERILPASSENFVFLWYTKGQPSVRQYFVSSISWFGKICKWRWFSHDFFKALQHTGPQAFQEQQHPCLVQGTMQINYKDGQWCRVPIIATGYHFRKLMKGLHLNHWPSQLSDLKHMYKWRSVIKPLA